MKSRVILTENIRTLLHARRMTDLALAEACGHRAAWLSKILSGERGIKLEDLDRIADVFDVVPADLFRHGITPMVNRRRRLDRRVGPAERRQGQRRVPDDADPTG
jgi:transcriptional regulator with XRE-family HTH domain